MSGPKAAYGPENPESSPSLSVPAPVPPLLTAGALVAADWPVLGAPDAGWAGDGVHAASTEPAVTAPAAASAARRSLRREIIPLSSWVMPFPPYKPRSYTLETHLRDTLGRWFMAAELVKIVWGSSELVLQPPDIFAGPIDVLGNTYPVYRLFVIAIGVLIALLLWLAERRTRIGAIIRAGVADRQMVAAL